MTTNQPVPIISLTTDFGQSDGYVGAMQGVIFNICPAAKTVTVSHHIPPQNIQAAAFVLYQVFDYYPAHTVHCVVVDPGVGSQRKAVAVRTSHGVFVGPDNGVFSLVLGATDVLEAVTLTNPQYQLPHVSTTFHGRDIFAPASAHIAGGVPLNQLGDPVADLTRTEFGAGITQGECRVIHIDHFGNLILDITTSDITNPDQLTLTTGSTVIKTLSTTFADVPDGELLAYVGSTRGHIEIAARNGNAAKLLDLQLGGVVQILL
jgi:S-adenosylmethionine hydrolase